MLPRVASSAPMRRGLREIVLRAYTAMTPDAARPSYPAGHGYSVSLP
jgi:hypothetical protein